MPKIVRRLGQVLSNRSKVVLLLINLVAYYFLLRWAYDNIQPGKLAEYFSKIPSWALLGSLIIHLSILALCGLRMTLLVGRKFSVSFSIINVGYALNTLLPLRIGEPIKIYMAHRAFNLPLIGVFAASVAEKMIDLFMILLLAILILMLTASQFIELGKLLSIAVLAFIGMTFIFILRRNVVRIIRFFPKSNPLRRSFIELYKHASGYRFGRILSVTVAIWILNATLVLFSFNTYLPEAHISGLDAISLLVIMALAVAIPSAPAGIGLFEAGIVAYLIQKPEIGLEAALVSASVFHLVITLPQLVLASRLLWSMRKPRPNNGIEKIPN